jgi:branched-chain amino acid transport system permease protein
MDRRAPILSVAALAGLLIALQLLTAACGKPFYLTQLSMAAYYAVVVMGLCLVMGYAGQISLGHGAFFAIGGYTSALLTTRNLGAALPSGLREALLHSGILTSRQDLYGAQAVTLSPWLACLAALALAALIALALGFPALRLKGQYLAMGTLGFGLIVYRVLLGTEILGGVDGIASVPAWHILPGVYISGDRAQRVLNYYVAWAAALGVLVLILNLTRSRIGRALRSIHDGERAANAMGINTAAYKLMAFVLSAVIAAFAGCLFTHYNGGIDPSEAGVMKSVRYVALVAVGGMANVWGALILGAGLTFLSLRGCFGTFDHAVFGALLILIMSLTPEGPLQPLAALVQRIWRWRPRGRRAATPATAPGNP